MDFEKIANELKESKVETGNRYTGISEQSIKNYLTKIKTMEKNKTFDKLNEYSNPNSRLSYQTAILAVAKHSPYFKEYIGDDLLNKIRDEQTIFIKQTKPMTNTQIKTEHENENWIDWKDLLKLVKKKNETEPIDQENLLLEIYTSIPPARLDFHNLLIVKPNYTVSDPKQNYIQLISKTKAKLFLKDYKTSATNGIIETDLPVKFAKRIWEFVEQEPERVYLFEKNNGVHQPFASAETFGKYLKKCFHDLTGKNISVDLLRHSFITEFRKGDRTLKEKEKVAGIMGNSVAVQENYRRVE